MIKITNHSNMNEVAKVDKLSKDSVLFIAYALEYVLMPGSDRKSVNTKFEKNLDKLKFSNIDKRLVVTLPYNLKVLRLYPMDNVKEVLDTLRSGKTYYQRFLSYSFSKITNVNKLYFKGGLSGLGAGRIPVVKDLSKMSGYMVPMYLVLKWLSREDNARLFVEEVEKLYPHVLDIMKMRTESGYDYERFMKLASQYVDIQKEVIVLSPDTLYITPEECLLTNKELRKEYDKPWK